MKNVHNSVLIIEQKNLKVFSPQINCCQQEERIDWTFWKTKSSEIRTEKKNLREENEDIIKWAFLTYMRSGTWMKK